MVTERFKRRTVTSGTPPAPSPGSPPPPTTLTRTVAEAITHLPFGSVSGYRQGNGVVTTLGYDTEYRIASLHRPAASPSGASTYHYTQGASRLTHITGAGATSFGHNANGNITSKGYQVFVYNADDRLSQVRLGNNQQIAAYTYDLHGKRISKYATGQTRYFHYDQEGHLIAETDETENRGTLYQLTVARNRGADRLVRCNGRLAYSFFSFFRRSTSW